jgi:hypothetical protein
MREDGAVSDDAKTPVEQALDQAVDVFVHAPIGLIFDGPASLPKLIKAGRNQVTSARMIGQFAVQQGQTEATKAIARLQEQAVGVLGLLGGPSTAPAPAAPRPAQKAPAPVVTPEPELPSEGLAIPDYDSLSASQVVSRLAGLGAAELDAVRAYESAKRGRKTILNKIAQLQRD